MRQPFHQPSDPAYHIEECQISKLNSSPVYCSQLYRNLINSSVLYLLTECIGLQATVKCVKSFGMKMIDIFDRLDNTCVAFLMSLWGCQIFTSCSTFRYTIPFIGIVIEIFFNAFLFTLFWHLFFLNSVTKGKCILFFDWFL